MMNENTLIPAGSASTQVRAGSLEDIAISIYLELYPGFGKAFSEDNQTIGPRVYKLVEEVICWRYKRTEAADLKKVINLVLDHLFRLTAETNRDHEFWDPFLEDIIYKIKVKDLKLRGTRF